MSHNERHRVQGNQNNHGSDKPHRHQNPHQRSKNALLRDVLVRATWDGPGSDQQLERAKQACRQAYPGDYTENEIERLVNRGKHARQSLESIRVSIIQKGSNAADTIDFIERYNREYPELHKGLDITIKKCRETLIRDVFHKASWGKNGNDQFDKAQRACLNAFPEEKQEIDAAAQRGLRAHEQLKAICNVALAKGKDAEEARDLLQTFISAYPELVKRANRQINWAHGQWSKGAQVRARKAAGELVSTVSVLPSSTGGLDVPKGSPGAVPAPQSGTAMHVCDIRACKPSNKWTLLIDETGNVFDNTAEQLKADNKLLGCFVGLLLPDSHGLGALPPRWHAAEQDDIAEIDRVIQAILDNHAGVLGITMQQLVIGGGGSRWAAGVMQLIDLVFRLLPLDGDTYIHIQVEQHDEFLPGADWNVVIQNSLLELSHAYPDRARKIACDIEIISKDGSPFNGYVDALAYIWGAGPNNEHAKACLQQADLEGTCFLEGDAKLMSRAWQWLDAGQRLDGMDWAVLLADGSGQAGHGLSGAILERLGQSAKSTPDLWRRYLDHTLGHINSKSVDLRELGRQVEWLDRWSPEGLALPKAARLLWLTTRLARANHFGETERQEIGELKQLGYEMLSEEPQLVCGADLHIAVNATNCYEFALASEHLEKWRHLPEAVAGRRGWGKLQSSFGQHVAFQREYAQARQYFDAGIETFGRLSDKEEGEREAVQTRTYRAIVLMDDPDVDNEASRLALMDVIGSIDNPISSLAVSAEPRHKFLHHLLLRWLIYRGEPGMRTEYLAHADEWQTGEGYPWPMIQLYRGMLLIDSAPENARAHAMHAYRMAMEKPQGATVRLIGACCRAIAASWGEEWAANEAEQLLGSLDKALPAAASHITYLREYLRQGDGDPRLLLRDVLPFNFH